MTSVVVANVGSRVGASIRVARRQAGWTIADLADRVGVSRATMSKIEAGDTSVAFGSVIAAATFTRVDVAEIINLGPGDLQKADQVLDALDQALPDRVRRSVPSNAF